MGRWAGSDTVPWVQWLINPPLSDPRTLLYTQPSQGGAAPCSTARQGMQSEHLYLSIVVMKTTTEQREQMLIRRSGSFQVLE